MILVRRSALCIWKFEYHGISAKASKRSCIRAPALTLNETKHKGDDRDTGPLLDAISQQGMEFQ